MTEDMAIREEEVFFELCYNVLMAFKAKNAISEYNTGRYLNELVESYESLSFNTINLNDPAYAYSYVYHFGPQSAVVVRRKLLLAMVNCQHFRETIESIPGQSLDNVSSVAPAPRGSAIPVMNVVNVGAGPGMDMVGFLSAVYGSLKVKEINFTLIEPVSTFQKFEDLIEAKLRRSNVGSASRLLDDVTLKTLFLKNSLPCHEDAFIRSMKNAHIILVSNLLSVVPVREKENIVQNIRDYMQDSALMVWIDWPWQVDYITGFDTLYEELEDNYSRTVFSYVPYYYTELLGPISERSRSKVRIMKKSQT